MRKLCWILILLVSCNTPEEGETVDIQGHRGARGLLPENSIPAFLKAAELGVKTMELDLVVSGDGQLVVSHEPYFSPVFCLDTLGAELQEDSVINIYQLPYEEVMRYDCGSKGNPRFPEQHLIHTTKPLLSEVIDAIESFESGRFFYNIELKTTKETDSIFHPSPEVFSDLVYQLISDKGLWDRVNIQSFDFRTLQYFRRKYPEVKLALLIENELSWETNVDSLGFTPEIYSCYFKLLDVKKVKGMQDAGMKVIPWTINEYSDLKLMLELGVDGIITDYPDRAINLISKNEQKI